jgi:poly-gamma-glutamate synthesis protein (capsule biosynthesis protein)
VNEDPRARRRRRRRRVHWGEIALAVVAVAVLGAGVAWGVQAAVTAGRGPAKPAPAVQAAATATVPAPAAPATAPPEATATATVTPQAGPSDSPTITFAAVGDLLFDLGPRSLIGAQGGAAPLAKVAAVLRAADVTIANLETTLSNRGAAVLGKPSSLIFNGDPRGVQSLTSAGVDFVSLANNHAMDHGTIALTDTLAVLDKAGIRHVGAGLDITQAWKPATMTVRGRRIVYVTATQVVPAHFAPSSTRAGVAIGTPISRVVAAVRAAARTADIVVVSVHWGVEQSLTPTVRQKHDARALIDAGADVVISHHPHVMQGIDSCKGKLIAYSLGNFLFPYKTVEGRNSFILRFDYGPKGVANITAVPVYLGQWGRPVVQTGASARSILRKLAARSKPFGTTLNIKNDIGYIKL